MALGSPTMMLSTPGGIPLLSASSANAKAVSGVASAGLRTTCSSNAHDSHIGITSVLIPSELFLVNAEGPSLEASLLRSQQQQFSLVSEFLLILTLQIGSSDM